MPDRLISNRDLRLSDVPSGAEATEDEIYRFAHTFDGYAVWGDRDRCWAVGRSVCDPFGPPLTDPLPRSLLKLRTALFTAVRVRRFTDLDGDITWDPATLPESFKADPAKPSSQALFDQHLRALVGAVEVALREGQPLDLKIEQAISAAVPELQNDPEPKERELRVAVGTALAALVEEPVASSATGHEADISDVPGWRTNPGNTDLVVGHDEHHPRLVAEMKWAKVPTFSHSVWDVMKVIGVLAKSAEAAYLITGCPQRCWTGGARYLALYQEGPVDLDAMPLEKEFPSFREASPNSIPDAFPNQIDVREICRVPLACFGESWEIRAVAIEPGGRGWLHLPNGDLTGAIPLQEVAE